MLDGAEEAAGGRAVSIEVINRCCAEGEEMGYAGDDGNRNTVVLESLPAAADAPTDEAPELAPEPEPEAELKPEDMSVSVGDEPPPCSGWCGVESAEAEDASKREGRAESGLFACRFTSSSNALWLRVRCHQTQTQRTRQRKRVEARNRPGQR